VIPFRADVLKVIRVLGQGKPMLMLPGDGRGYGARWTLSGQEIPPAIACYLMDEGFIAEHGQTEFGAKRLVLTASGDEFLREGNAWWSGLTVFQKLRATLFG
jgi:hypothetical protein